MVKPLVSALVVSSALSFVAACGGEPKPAESPADVKEGDPTTDPPPAPKPPQADPQKKSANEYDKENTEVVLKRAARSVKESCGEAKDENGVASGPFGKVTIQVLLGRNGHSKGVTVPASHAEKPAGKCIVNAFSNLAFPPWAGQDTSVDWEVELVQPAAPAAPPKKK